MSEEIINNEEVAEVIETTPEASETISEIAEATSEETLSPVETVVEDVVAEAPVAPANTEDSNAPKGRLAAKKTFNRGGAKGGRNARPARPPREKPEFDSKAIDVRRVTRVTSGGRRFSLHVTMVAGDRNGRVGLGVGKALDTQAAMDKAMKDAKKNMIKFNLDDKKTIKHEVAAKYDTAEVWISPNKEKGLIAGSSARVILSLAGLQNVTAKFHGGTKNKLNNARATMRALAKVSTRA